jgi:hypothetical protein
MDPIQKFIGVEKLLQYDFAIQVYSVNTQVPLDPFCNGFSVKNIAAAGGATVVVMGDPLTPGQSKNFGGNRGEVFTGRLDIDFTGAGSQLALVTQKYYTNIPLDAK